VLTGVGMALLASLGWAGSSVILKFLTTKVDTVTINTLRLWTGTSLLLIFVIFSGRYTALFDFQARSLVYVATSGILAMAIGDTVYIKSLALLDASIAFPIAQCAFVLFSGFAAVIWFDEPYTWITLIGAALIIGGIYLIATGGKTRPIDFQSLSLAGVSVTLIAAAFWAAAAIAVKIGSEDLDVFVVAAVRISVATVVLTLLTVLRRKTQAIRLAQYDARTLLLGATAGLLTYGIAGVAFVYAIQTIGAGKSVLLTSTAPLFALPLAILFLKERPTTWTFAGVVISIAGVYLVVI
jgi:drug/metabolite transporter (DMT)-like permease